MTTGEQAISRRSAPRIAVFVVLAGLVGGVVTGTPAWAADDPAGLQVDTVTSTEVAYGNTATWSFTVTNTGTRATAGPVTMAFQYNQGSNPPDAAILSAWDQAKVTATSGTCSLSTQKRTGTCVTGALRPGQSVTMTTTARQHFASSVSGFTGWGFTVVRGKSDPNAPWNARYSGTTLVPVRGNLDRVLPVSGGVQVAGWVVELERLSDPMTVTAQVDGAYTDRFTTTVRRADVNRALHVSGNRGFAGIVSMSAGTHRLCLTAGDPYWGTSTIDFGCRDVQVR